MGDQAFEMITYTTHFPLLKNSPKDSPNQNRINLNWPLRVGRVGDRKDATTGSSRLCAGSKSLPLAVEGFALPAQEGDRSERGVLDSPTQSFEQQEAKGHTQIQTALILRYAKPK